MVLLDQFRCRFDPKWRPRPSQEIGKEDVATYFKVARHWIGEDIWAKRPWRIQNLPLVPRCLITNPHSTIEQKEESVRQIHDYVHYCTGFRDIIRAFPDILCDPGTWELCLLIPTDEAVKIAEQKRTRPKREEVVTQKLVIAKVRNHIDVVFPTFGYNGGKMIDVVNADGSCVNMDGKFLSVELDA